MVRCILIFDCALLLLVSTTQVLQAAATEPPKDGSHRSHSAAWNAGKRREHGELLDTSFYSDDGGGGGGGNSQHTAITVAAPAAAAAAINGEPSEQRSLQESRRPSMTLNADASATTADGANDHYRRRHRKSDDGNDRERHELDEETDTERYMGATAKQFPDVTVDTRDEEELQSPETSTSHTPLVPSFCSAEAFERYVSLHEAITAGNVTQRYLVYRPYLTAGMGNRLNGFHGSLGLAILTNRALIVDWSGGMSRKPDGIFEDTFLEHNGIPHDIIPSSLEGFETAPDTEIWCQMVKSPVSRACVDWRMTKDFLAGASWDQVYAANATVVVIQAHNKNPMSFLEMNTDLMVVEQLARLNAEFGLDAFGVCAERFLFRARPEFKKDYCDERGKIMNGKFPGVSIHFRTGDKANYRSGRMESLSQDIDNALACAAGFEEGLKSVAAELPSGVFDVDLEHTDIVWPLGTDSNSVIDILNESNRTVAVGGKVTYIEGDEYHRAHTGTKLGHVSAAGPLMDMAMLSESVLLVGSYRSSYTRHIAELGGLPKPLRLFIHTPFTNLFTRPVPGRGYYFKFEDYRQGCTDFVTDPSKLGFATAALLASREPFIDCSDYSG